MACKAIAWAQVAGCYLPQATQNLMDDGWGGMRCMPGYECNVGKGWGKAPEELPDGFLEGDWMCPGCGDHQFAKNQQCRKCGAPRPKPEPNKWVQAETNAAVKMAHDPTGMAALNWNKPWNESEYKALRQQSNQWKSERRAKGKEKGAASVSSSLYASTPY